MYMGLSSLQVCMDSPDWLQGTIHDESSGLDSSSPSGDMLACSRPLVERRLRPQHEQAPKCPRCDSTHTKFCYYNNYSLSQPRYFCKTCRRYWTKGGTLRNIPVGGGCRKNKKVSKKTTASDPPPPPPPLHHLHHSINNQNPGPSSSMSSHQLNSPTDLHLSSSSFPDPMQFSQFDNIIGTLGNDPNVMGTCNVMLENPRGPIDFMESTTKLEASSYDFMGNCDLMGGHHGLVAPNFHGFCSPYGMSSLDHGSGRGASVMDTCQRFMLPYYYANDHQDQSHHAMDVKPNTKALSLEWQDAGKESSDYGLINNNLGSWTTSTAGMINGYGSSTSNPLV